MCNTLQLRNGDEKAEFMVDGWNAWFYDDLKNLVSVCLLKYRKYNRSFSFGLKMKKGIFMFELLTYFWTAFWSDFNTFPKTPICYTPGIYAEGYIVFVFPFVHLYVHSLFHYVNENYVKVLC